MTYGADMLWVLSTMAYMMPDILALSVPMAFQIAILMTLTSMSQSGEIMALRAAGFSFKEIARPIFIVAVCLVFVMLALNSWLSPLGRAKVEESKEDIASKISKVNVEPKTFINLGDWDFFTEDVDKKHKTLSQVHLSRKNDDTALSTRINAATGKIAVGKAGVSLDLFNGQMQRVDSVESRKIITAEFDKYNLFIPLTFKAASKRTPKASELTTLQLIKRLRLGQDDPKRLADYRPEPVFRLSMALAPIIFFFLSCPVAFVTNKKAGRASAMIFSILFIFGYFGLITVGGNIGEKVPFWLISYTAPLLPVVVGLIVSKYLWRKRLSN